MENSSPKPNHDLFVDVVWVLVCIYLAAASASVRDTQMG